MTLISEGTFRARATEGALGFTSKGSEQIAVSLQLLDGPDEGKAITWYGYFTDKTMDRTLESLRLLGWASDDLSDLTGIDQQNVHIVVEHETDNDGVVRARVRWINGGGGVQLKERMNEGEAKSFAAKMKGRVLAYKMEKGSPPPAQRPAAAAGRSIPPAANSGGQSRDFAPGPTPDNADNIPFSFNESVCEVEGGIGERWNAKRTARPLF